MQRLSSLAIAFVAMQGFQSALAQLSTTDKPPSFSNFSGGWDQLFTESDDDRKALEAIPVSIREERQAGGDALRGFLASLKQQRIRVTQQGRDAIYVSSLVELIRPRMKHARRYPSIAVYIAKHGDVDARAFPGGSIVVTTGLLEFAGSEAALVGILGHELSHIDHGHQLRMVRAMKMAQQGWMQGVERPGDMQRQIQALSSNFARPYRSEDEEVADGEGATWTFELGYDPMEMANLFRRLDGVTVHAPASLPNFLRTHPYNVDRYAAIKALTDSLQRGNPRKLFVGSKSLSERTPGTARK